VKKFSIACPSPTCNGHGKCDPLTGKCLCSFGYGGDDCSLRLCLPNNCSYPNGTCNFETGVCTCDELHEGVDCSLLSCPATCINNGTCDPLSGTCICFSGWTGVTCALVKCPNDCSGNGKCAGGQCFCSGRWKGAACNVEEPDYAQIAILAIVLFIVGIILIAGGFLIWRQVTISQLTKKLENLPQQEQHEMDEISSSDDD